MNAPLRRVAIAVFVLFGLLFANLNYVQFFKGREYRTDPINQRVQLQEYEHERGQIVVGDGETIASSKETDGRLKYQRVYGDSKADRASLYAHVTGYKSPNIGATGIEQVEDEWLSGTDDRLWAGRISDIVTRTQPRGGNVVLTLNRQVQKAAADGLRGRKGAIVALDPKSGEILGLVSGPTYDPNVLASHDPDVQSKAWDSLKADRDQPLRNRALRETYPPGSTFKVIVAAAAIKDGANAETVVDSPLAYAPPQAPNSPIKNFAGRSCGADKSSLKAALTVSCNTAFAKLGVELGEEKVGDMARQFGFEEGFNMPLKVDPSKLGNLSAPPVLAQSSIGQRDVKMTPLQGAMIAAAVANNGSLMRPYLIKELQAPDLTRFNRGTPRELHEPLTEEQARELQKMMRGVVESGTGKQARVAGVEVGGKTGTAEDGFVRQDHSWFIGYASKDGVPLGAVAVVLENAGTSSAATASIAGDVLQAIVAARGNR